MISERQQQRAYCIINSWLKSKGILCINSEIHEKNDYRIELTEDENKLDGNTFFININHILSNDNKISQNALNKIFEKFNGGMPGIFVRTENPAIAYYKDDYEGVYLRHTALNRAPNLSIEKMKQFDDVVKSEAHKAYRKFQRLAMQTGFDYEDLYNIGLVHLTTFLHEHERPNLVETRKILRICLRQRFDHWAKVTVAKHKNSMTNTMYLSEEIYNDFKSEILYRYNIETKDNQISVPEFEYTKMKVKLHGYSALFEIRPENNVPKYFIDNEEYSRTELVKMITNQELKLR